MNPTTATQNVIQGVDILLQISDDNGENWYTLICGESQDNDATRDIKQRTTQCGTVVGKGASVKRNVNFKGVFNVVDDVLNNGEGFASGQKLRYWHNAGTALLVRQIAGDNGATYINKSSAYISNYKESAPVDDVLDFNVSFFMFGTWVITA